MFWGIYRIFLWHHTGCALIYEGRSVFPHRFCSAKGPPGCPGRVTNLGSTEWQAGALTIELRLTLIELCLTLVELRLTLKYINVLYRAYNVRDESIQGHCVSGRIHLWDQGSQSILMGTHRFGTSTHSTIQCNPLGESPKSGFRIWIRINSAFLESMDPDPQYVYKKKFFFLFLLRL